VVQRRGGEGKGGRGERTRIGGLIIRRGGMLEGGGGGGKVEGVEYGK